MRTYNILDYGAIEADLLQTKAIQAAIDDCFLAGGGEVIIPSGIYRTGGLRIRSNVVLHLLQGAILEGSGNPDDYTAWKEDKLEPVDFSDIEPSKYRSATRTSRWNNAMIRAFDAHDIAIIGEPGSILNGMNCYDPTGEENYRGPHGIDLWDCERVTLRGYTVRATGNWAHAIFRTRELEVRDITVQGGHDGVDVFLCENVLIEDCKFWTGDDSLAGFGSKNVVMRRCILNSSCSSIRFGGTDVLIEECENHGESRFAHRWSLSEEDKARSAFTNETHSRCDQNVFLYYCDERFGKLPYEPGNIVIRNCNFDGVCDLFRMTFGKHIWCCGESLRSIIFENCCLENLSLPIGIYGDKDNPTEFRLRNVRLSARNGIKSQIFIDAENCSRIELTNVKLEGYTSPKLVLRSECEVIINACDDFELERSFCENACEQCDRKGQMPEGEYNV